MKVEVGPPEFESGHLSWRDSSLLSTKSNEIAHGLAMVARLLSENGFEKVDWPEIQWLDDRVEAIRHLVGVDPSSEEGGQLLFEFYRIAGATTELEHIPDENILSEIRDVATEAAKLVVFQPTE